MQVHVREGTRCTHIAPQTIEFWRRHVSRPGEVDAENASIRPGPSPIASTRSADSAASSTEWVTKMAVTPVYTVEEIADRASRVLAQGLENGISGLMSTSTRSEARAADGRLSRKRECLGFDFHENATKRSDAAVKCRRLGALEVRKKPSDPRLKMCLEDVEVRSTGSNDLATGKAAHDFEKYRSVILGFRLPLSPLKANLLQGFAGAGVRRP